MKTIHEQLYEQRLRRTNTYNSELKTLTDQHLNDMNWYDDFQYQVPRLLAACKKAKVEIVNITAQPHVTIELECNPKGFQKMNEDAHSIRDLRKLCDRSEKIQNEIASLFKCTSVKCERSSLLGDGYILILIKL
jgi:hypothetical protein